MLRHTTPSSPRFHRRVSLAPLVMLIFFTVSGGAYGLEEAVGQSGAGMALLLLVLAPLLWSLPSALMTAELAAALPEEGGYYLWVQRPLGPFWGFIEGWWSWANSFVDMAIYPVLFTTYLSALLARAFDIHALDQHDWLAGALRLAMIWGCVLLNLRGIRPVGAAALLLGVLVLAPFLALTVIGFGHLAGNPAPVWRPFLPEGRSAFSAAGLGLFVVLWNYLGWESVSTAGAEIEQPRRAYPRALAIALPLVVFAYLLPVIAGLGATRDLAGWSDGSFPDIAALVGGDWLGVWLAAGGALSAVGLFGALLLSNSRLPFVLAEDGSLPPLFRRFSARFETPWPAIIISAAIYSVFSLGGFESLVVLDVSVYAAALLLEFAAFIALRLREPDLPRPVRVPGGMAVAWLIAISPLAVLALAIASTLHDGDAGGVLVAALTLLSGPLLYPLLRNRWPATRAGSDDQPLAIAPNA